MRDVVIVSAVRTPIGQIRGALAGVRPDDMAAIVIAEAVRRAGIDPVEIEEVYLGCANQAGEDNRNVARMALLLAGLPEQVAGLTFNRLCASGLSAGDEVKVTLELDTEPRTVDVPDDLADALEEAGVTRAFEKSAPSARKEFVRQVESAKTQDTRERRIAKIVEKLRES